jgi:hypothetical protein
VELFAINKLTPGQSVCESYGNVLTEIQRHYQLSGCGIRGRKRVRHVDPWMDFVLNIKAKIGTTYGTAILVPVLVNNIEIGTAVFRYIEKRKGHSNPSVDAQVIGNLPRWCCHDIYGLGGIS